MSEIASSPFCRLQKVFVNGAGNMRCLAPAYRHFVPMSEITLDASAIVGIGIRVAAPREHARRWRVPSLTVALAVDERVAIVEQP